jgi:hypothetical protein
MMKVVMTGFLVDVNDAGKKSKESLVVSPILLPGDLLSSWEKISPDRTPSSSSLKREDHSLAPPRLR